MTKTIGWRRAIPYLIIGASTIPVAVYAYTLGVFVVVMMMVLLCPWLLAMQYRRDIGAPCS